MVEEADESDCHSLVKYFGLIGEEVLYYNDFL